MSTATTKDRPTAAPEVMPGRPPQLSGGTACVDLLEDSVTAQIRPDSVAERRSWIQIVAMIVPAAAISALFFSRWSTGWLLLLDSSPGPRSPAWSGPALPVGIALNLLTGALAAASQQLVGWALPAGAVIVSFVGGVRLARCWLGPSGRPMSGFAAAIGGCIAAANPFIASRVYAGQIGVLWGSATLWWLVSSVLRSVDRSDRRSWLLPGTWLAVTAACTVHLALIGMIPILLGGVLLHRRHDCRTALVRTAASLALGVGLTGIWLVPALFARGAELGRPGDRAAVLAFSSGGPLSTLWLRALGGAGFWRPLPVGSLTTFGVLIAVAWAATILAWRHGNGHSRDTRHLLLACSVAAVGAAYLGHGPLAGPWSWLCSAIWPAGLLREPGKVLMLAVMAPACGAAAFTQQLIDSRLTESRHRGFVLGSAAVALTLILSLVAWSGLLDQLTPSSYPKEWIAARSITEVDNCAISVLGDGAYTDPGFTTGRIVAHPAHSFFGPRSILSDDPRMEGLVPRTGRTAAARWSTSSNRRYLNNSGRMPTAADARRVKVGWVFVDRPIDHPRLARDLDGSGFHPVYRTSRAGLWRTPGGCT